MKAIVLAAGRGSRLGTLTSESPKCLVEYRSKALLEHTLLRIRKYFDDKDIFLVGGYKSDLLHDFHSNVLVNEAWDKTNIMGSLFLCNELLLTEDCLIIYSDIYFEDSAIDSLVKSKSPSVLNLLRYLEIWGSRFTNPIEDLETFVLSQDRSHLIEIGEAPKSLNEVQGQFGGIFKLNPETWMLITKEIENISQLDTTTVLNMCLKLGVRFNLVNYDGFWAEFDSKEDLLLQP
jgi:choline kinase